MKSILCIGSLNLDHVYRVPTIVNPGETLSACSFEVNFGGKGANQSVALARAGATINHAGCVGPDGTDMVNFLGSEGVDTSLIRTVDHPTGKAVIQVDNSGENAIVLFEGANGSVDKKLIEQAISGFDTGDILLLQNEIPFIDEAIRTGHKQGMTICFNPAPFSESVLALPLDLVNILVVNETEGQGLSGKSDPESCLKELHSRFPECRIIMTLGKNGVLYGHEKTRISLPIADANVIDTTAAGDCFIGYFLTELLKDRAPQQALQTATQASAIAVSRSGAMTSIPNSSELCCKT